MREGYFVMFHKIKKTQVKNSIYFEQLVHSLDTKQHSQPSGCQRSINLSEQN